MEMIVDQVAAIIGITVVLAFFCWLAGSGA